MLKNTAIKSICVKLKKFGMNPKNWKRKLPGCKSTEKQDKA